MSLNVLQVIERAMRLNGSLAAGDTPSADDEADCLTAFNTLKRSWYGTLIGARLTAQEVSLSPVQAENGGEYLLAAIAGGATLMAPASPRGGARFGVVDAALSFATYACSVAPSAGTQIEGGTSGLVLSATGDNRRWWFRNDTGNWVREADFASLTAAIEFPDQLIAYMPYMLAAVIAPEFNAELRADVVQGTAEGRQLMARLYAPRGRGEIEPPLGIAWPQPPVQQAANA